MSIGLKRGTVSVGPHDPAWDRSAQEVITDLKSILGADAVDIQHIGSTSIQSIVAKPIIDIAVGVRGLDDMRKHDGELSGRGFTCRGQDVEGQLLYVLGQEDLRTHHIHTVLHGSADWNNYVNFRDYLNCHPEAAARYSALKEELGGKYAEDRGAYTRNKQEMIDQLLAEARAWRAEVK